MTLKVGRVSLSVPLSIGVRSTRSIQGIQAPSGATLANFSSAGEESYAIEGREVGSSAQTTMTALVKEGKRLGAVYVEDSDSLLPSGYYELEAPDYQKPGGAPTRRPWSIDVTGAVDPWVARQAEDDNPSGVGTDTADVDADEGSKVVYTATASEVKVLDPRNVTGAEKVNLPAGSWKVLARVQSRTTFTQKFRARFTDEAGNNVVSGAQVTVAAADTWTELNLGTLVIPAADDKDNWYTLEVQANVDLNDVWIDRVYFLPA